MKLATLLFSITGLILALFFTASCSNRPPNDQALVEQFYAHKSDFEKLRAMLQTDAYVRSVSADGIETTNSISYGLPEILGMPKERYDEYVSAMKAAGTISAGHDKDFIFLIKCWGFVTEGWCVGVVAKTLPPTNQVQSLEQSFTLPSATAGVYKHLENDWYLWLKR